MIQKRILQVIRPAEGGMKGHLLTLAGGLINRGYLVEVACPGDSSLAAELREMGLRVHPISLVGPLSPGPDLICVLELRNIFRHGQYDIIHFHGAKAGMVGRIATALTGCLNTVVTVHNFIVYEEVPWPKKILFRYGEQFLSRVTNRIITVSKALRDDLVLNYKIRPEKITPIYNGIDTLRFQQTQHSESARAILGISPSAVAVGTVARMASQKGLNYLVEAFARMYRAGQVSPDDTAFVIAGDGPLRPQLEKQADDLGIRDKIIFPGFVDDMPLFLACLDVFVVPSVAEGLSISTIEAMAAGLPVVASRVGGLPELVRTEETGFLVEPRNPTELAEAIFRLLTDSETRKQMGINGRKLAIQQFNTENMIEQTCALYNEMLKQQACAN